MPTYDPNHDYTREDIPFDENPDEFVIGSAVALKDVDAIEKDNTFNPVPPGNHMLVVAGFADKPKEAFYKVMLNGRLASFRGYSIRVRFALPNDPKTTISDFFLLPPNDPAEQKAYFEGIPEGKKQAGWAASKFVHFINRLGFTWPAGQALPEAARKLGNWKGRTIRATVEAGSGTYKDKNGVDKPNGPQIKLFSYQATQATIEGRPTANGMSGGQPGYSPATVGTPGPGSGSPGASQRQTAPVPVPVPVNAGLDDI